MNFSRRHFLSTAAAAGAGFLGLRHLLCHAEPVRDGKYGPLVRDPRKMLDLPEGFTYRVFSKVGDPMSDGFRVPGAHDGMAAFPGPEGRTILVRNHELRPDSSGGPFGSKNNLFEKIDRALLYDPGHGKSPSLGGTTTVVFDTKTGKVEQEFLSLAGTIRNCAGGPTPWNSWLTCEETMQRADKTCEKDHGYVFEVPATAKLGLAAPVPLKAMGRFNHEAVAVDPGSGAVYLTEDRSDGLLYRFLPVEAGNLARGGRLQALMVRGRERLNTSNQRKGSLIPVGAPLETDWIDMDDVDSPNDDLRKRGYSKGAAQFTRGEGIWYGREAICFACTSGGRNGKGQIWRYRPSPAEGTPGESMKPGVLDLFVEPNDAVAMENADNLTVAPWGDLLICENGKAPNQVVGVTPEGKLYPFARNAANSSEVTGATVSPDGSTLFFNVQKPGWTVAVTGPWRA